MVHRDNVTRRVATLVTFAIVVAGASSASAQTASSLETKCAAKVAKMAAKLASTVAKEIGKCKNADISGKTTGGCPTTKNSTKISKMRGKLAKAANKTCGSICSGAGHGPVPCMADSTCPPLSNGAHELCTAGALLQVFDMGNIGFPGPFCLAAVGHQITVPDDLATCVGSLTEETANDLVDAIYGGLTNASVSGPAAKCLSGLSKAAQKLSSTIYKGVVKCRDSINKGKTVGNPATCTRDDAKLAAKITKAEQKVRDAAAKCDDAMIQELDLCGSSVTPLTTTEAADCVIAAAEEITDSTTAAGLRTYAGRSLVEAAYPPPRGVCGDNTVNQVPSPFALLGEECDGTDDSACPGQCLPPGDLFECTCGNIKRVRYMADGITADLDNGWTGTSHNQGVADKSAHVFELANCDCDQLDPTGITCTGSTSDEVCDLVSHYQRPSCSWEPLSGVQCDDRATRTPSQGGTQDGSNKDADCYICDEFTANPGAYCANENDCQSQCYDTAGVAVGPCNTQSDCGTGEVCRGLCDKTQTCIIAPNGAPLPISSGGTAVCILSDFRVDVTGTSNIVTGEHETNERLFSKVHLGVNNLLPCPVCGGFCDDTGKVCEGTCSVTTTTSCRFDSDCPTGETCTTASPTCPGSFCNLSLVCNGGPNDDQPCRIEAATRDFGTTSHDCVPDPNFNISGEGLEINYLPQTSETVGLPDVMPCSNPGFKLFDCPCPDKGGRKNQPNLCAAACNAGAELGQGCATGSTQNGRFTTCAAGVNANFACDEDADCPGSTCSANPTHCTGTGDPNLELTECTTNGDCGTTGTCVDACPSGRCVPLCLPTLSDPEDGTCAAGPATYHCNGAHNEFIVCFVDQANGTCDAVCSGSGAPCVSSNDCPSGETCNGTCELAKLCEAGNDGIIGTTDDNVGAGICIADTRNCFLPGLAAEGGTIFNGGGTPTNPKSVAAFCIGATGNSAINSTAGLGGPGRLREVGVNVTNGFSTLP